MILKTLALSFAAAFASASFAFGHCDADAQRLCTSEEFHAETEKSCLFLNVDQIQDPLCKDFLKRGEADWKKSVESFRQVRVQCKAEFEKLCPDLAGAERKLKAQQTCLMAEGEKLGVTCKKELNRHIHDHQSNLREIP